MKIYAVYTKPGMQDAQERPVLVREAFSLMAFLFTFLWAIYYRLWLPLIYIVLFNVAVIFLARWQVLTEPSLAVIQLAFQLLVGLQASDWRQAKLRRKGYVLTDIAVADSVM